jgi:hypothetical protein
LAAGLETSARSFELLAKTIQSEGPNSKVRKEGDRFLTQYNDLARLPILENVLRASTSSEVMVVAAQRLDASAQRNLVVSSTPQPGEVGGYSLVPENAPRYERFVSILQSLIASPDQHVASQASSTLASLQAMLGQTPATNTAAN